MGLIVGLSVGGVILVAVLAVGVWYFAFRSKPTGSGGGPDPFPNMLAHWSFDKVQANPDETTTIFDDTGRGNDGKMVAGMLAPGRKGNALWLDGRGDQYVDLSKCKDLQAFAPNSELTLAAWFLAKEPFAGTVIALRHPSLPTQLDMFVRDGRVIGIIGDDEDLDGKHAFVWGEQRKNPPPTAADGRWHHVAMTRHGRVVEVFYDGVSQGVDSRGNSGGKLSGGLGAIGCNLGFVKEDVRTYGRHGFKGAIDEVYVFSRALPPHEIQALMAR